ncbi:PREDICTED: cyclin-dependent kinase 2-associated protein 1-like [Ceratosolen solmsi marchali]|uniref:Cyclin-dependent kinase 2-associated protein 1-like n=1 Tax=Ceratosolen solmsi marchali TaxID=326594 RepID=A0AAJ6YS04_9HYME|nr:PREDICTED: cyclin-dependent kinase 2-associated protein 1-like [Ceratosolen solmsi marchali]
MSNFNMDENSKIMDTQKKIVEPLIIVPKPRSQIHHQQQKNSNCSTFKLVPGTSKYAELLHVIEELGQHIRPSYAGHRGSAEKIRQGIIKARVLVRECLVETEKSARQ